MSRTSATALPTPLRELTSQLTDIANSIELLDDSLLRSALVKRFRIVLDQLEDLISREYPIE